MSRRKDVRGLVDQLAVSNDHRTRRAAADNVIRFMRDGGATLATASQEKDDGDFDSRVSQVIGRRAPPKFDDDDEEWGASSKKKKKPKQKGGKKAKAQ